MTEDEAKTKICCGPMYADFMMCMGSGCMAWRPTGLECVAATKDNVTYSPSGFCGLAGKP